MSCTFLSGSRTLTQDIVIPVSLPLGFFAQLSRSTITKLGSAGEQPRAGGNTQRLVSRSLTY